MIEFQRHAFERRGQFDHVMPPSTWDYLNPWKGGPRDLAVLNCPNGHGVRIVMDIHTIDHDGRLSPSVVCATKGCGFHDHVRLVGWDAEERIRGGR